MTTRSLLHAAHVLERAAQGNPDGVKLVGLAVKWPTCDDANIEAMVMEELQRAIFATPTVFQLAAAALRERAEKQRHEEIASLKARLAELEGQAT